MIPKLFSTHTEIRFKNNVFFSFPFFFFLVVVWGGGSFSPNCDVDLFTVRGMNVSSNP